MSTKIDQELPMCFHAPILPGELPSLSESLSMWVEWTRLDGASPTGKSRFCEDCQPEYKRQEVTAGRCQFPGTTFHVPDPTNVDDGVYGERHEDLRKRTDGPPKQARQWRAPDATGKISLGIARAKARQSAVKK